MMKKLFIFLMIFVCFSFASCMQEEDTSATSQTESTSAISQSEQTTETTSTTETAQTTTSATETTMQTTLGWRDQVEIRETAPIQTEIPELQEKIDSMNRNDPYVYTKVIIEIGDQRDIPRLFLIEEYDRGFAGCLGGMLGGSITGKMILEKKDKTPVYTVTGEEELQLYCNDVLKEGVTICVITDTTPDLERYYLEKEYASLAEAYNDLPKGKYYAHVSATCYGDYLLTEYGEPIEADWNPFGRKTEYSDYEAYFILEFQ